MSPHPRIRKTIKWTGAAVTVLLIAVWIGSGWCWVLWAGPEWQYSMSAGGIAVDATSWEKLPPPGSGWSGGFDGTGRFDVWMFRKEMDPYGFRLFLPLWFLPLVTLLPTVLAWRLDTLAHRRARLNLCPTCNYNRTGLAPRAICPECGTAPAAP